MNKTRVLLAVAILLAPVTASAADIRVLCSNGLRAVMLELVPPFEKATGHKVITTFGPASGLIKQIDDGVAFDIAIFTLPTLDAAIAQGTIAADSKMVIARSGYGIAIRRGAPRPRIGTADEFTRTLRAAKSIIYAKEGAAGLYFVTLARKLGLTEELAARTTLAGSGPAVSEAVERGEVELGILPISEILPVKGAELLGPFPPEVQDHVVMTAGLSTRPAAPAAARALILFLVSPSADAVVNAKGMER